MYFERFIESLTECEIICNEEAIKVQSIHPQDIISNKEIVLQEAIFSKEKIDVAFQKAREIFMKLTQQMMKITFELKKRNAKWFETVNRFDINKKDLKNFKFEMFNYQEGIKRIEDTPLPKFESVNIQDFSGNAEVFKQNAFKNLYMKDDQGNEDISKNYFRGSSEKITIDDSKAKMLFPYAVNWLRNYERFTKNIEISNETLNKIVNDVLSTNKVSVTESILLSESIFRDEYYDILLEDAVDPSDIEKEEKNNSNTINSNPEENKQNKEVTDRIEAAKKYWKICSSIQTMKMDIAREIYTVFTDFIDKVMT